MKILAIVVAYEPDMELLMRNIGSFAGSVDKVLLWQNSPVGGSWPDNVELCGDGHNVGISKALNYGWRRASAEGYDFLLTMDQDSVWHGFEMFLGKVTTEGIFAPGINAACKDGLREHDLLFTSGMLVPVGILDAVGGYREDFFVDGIDNDLVFHARSLGFSTWLVGGCYLEHSLGHREVRCVLGRDVTTYNYSPARLYGIYRNNIIVIRSYPGTGHLRRTFLKSWIWRHPLQILLAESGRCKKFRAIWLGLIDGLLGRPPRQP